MKATIAGRSAHRSADPPRTPWRPWLLATALTTAGMIVATAPAASAAVAPTTAAPQRIGVAPAVPHNARAVAPPADSTTLHLDVELAPRDPAALSAFVTAVSTPGSTQYHRYLPKGEFASVFGPTVTTIASVRNALTRQGLQPGQVTPDGLTIPVTTTVADAGRAFGIGFAGYTTADGHTGYTNTAAPQLPAAVARSVTDIGGLNNLVVATPQHTAPRHVVAMPTAGARPNTVRPAAPTPTVCAGAQQALTNAGLVDTRDYWEAGTLSAPTAYDTGRLYGQFNNTGQGVGVGLLELERFDPTDIANYQSCFGTNVPISTVQIDGGPTAPPSEATNVGLESALDIEIVAGLASGSSITVYQGPDQATFSQILDTYQRMVTDDSVKVISTSWGLCETTLNQVDPGTIQAESTIFASAAAQGQTVVAAAGDAGSTDCFRNAQSPNESVLTTDDPAGQPDVTSVGGTSMSGSAANQSTWNTPAGGGFTGEATGGGVSQFGTLTGAANYQNGVQGAGYSNACAAPAGTFCRQVPDVAALADPNTGYLVFFGQPGNGVQDIPIIGGTSGGAPLWAAVAALADASTACAGNGPVGLANPALYAHPYLLTDITTGTNFLPDSGYAGGLYSAGAGYDMTTGLGTPNAPEVVDALCVAGSTYTPVGPVRVLDTRAPIGVPAAAPIGQNSSISLQLTNSNGVPPGATAVVLNVTAVNPTAGSFLTVFPDGETRPVASNLNFTPGQTIPNLVTVPLSANGKVDIYNLKGSVDVVADLFGFYSTGAGSLYQPTSPVRVLDTRAPIGVPVAAPIGQNSSIPLQITGNNNVPQTGVTAVVLNVTATNPTQGSFLTVFPDGVTRPVASNLNFGAGQTIPNLVTVPVGSDGQVDFYNFHGSVDVVADLFGYFTSSGTGFKFHATAPHRLADTRDGTGVTGGQPTPIGPGAVFSLPIDGSAGPGNPGVPATSSALVLNVTVTAPTAGSFVTVYPSGVARPLASNLNFSAGQTIPNAVVTSVQGSSIDFFNHSGSTQLVVDLFGYYATT